MEDDDAFMYGEAVEGKQEEEKKDLESGEAVTEKPSEVLSEDEEEGDESSDDELEIVIAPETTTVAPPVTGTPSTLGTPLVVKPVVTSQVPIVGQPIPRMDGTVVALTGSHQPPQGAKPTMDLEAVAQYEGKDLYDADLDSFEDKPWRKPGADITDYFNYGFNELTWKMYCQKQRRIRDEMAMQMRMNADFPDFNMFGGEFPPPVPFGMMMPPGAGPMPGKYQRMPMYGGPRPPFIPGNPGEEDPESRKRDRDGEIKDFSSDAPKQAPMDFQGGPPRFPPGPMDMYGMPPPYMRHGFDPRGGMGPPPPRRFPSGPPGGPPIMPPPAQGRFERRHDDRGPRDSSSHHSRESDHQQTPPRHREEVRVKEKAESGRSSRDGSTERSESRGGGDRRSSHHEEEGGSRRSSKRKSKRRSRSRSRERSKRHH